MIFVYRKELMEEARITPYRIAVILSQHGAEWRRDGLIRKRDGTNVDEYSLELKDKIDAILHRS